jgi:hypothetical protein
MAEREYEEQPEAPDLGASTQLETSESQVGPPGAEPLDAGYDPPDRPYALDDDEVTPASMEETEALDDRLHREQPEVSDEQPAPEPGDAPDQLAGDQRSGRLAPAADTAIEGTGEDDAIGSTDAADVGISGGSAAAEEAAMHDLDDGPPMTDDEGSSEPTEEENLGSDPAPGP